MPLVETRAFTAKMSPTESTTTISLAGGAGSPWAYSIHYLPERPPRGVPFQSSIFRVRLTPPILATGRESAPIVPRRRSHKSVLVQGHRRVLELDLPETSGGAEYSKDLIQDNSPFRLGKRYTRIYRLTSIIADARPYRSRVSR